MKFVMIVILLLLWAVFCVDCEQCMVAAEGGVLTEWRFGSVLS